MARWNSPEPWVVGDRVAFIQRDGDALTEQVIGRIEKINGRVITVDGCEYPVHKLIYVPDRREIQKRAKRLKQKIG